MGSHYSYDPGTGTPSSIATGEVTESSKAFTYDNLGRLVTETTTETLYGTGSATSEIVFLYDQNTIIGMRHTSSLNGTNTYYFRRNLQGDVVEIYDTNGVRKVKYNYDAWGNCTIASQTTDAVLARVNPIRYRGYYYDAGTGLYCLNARYYNPQWRRFISPDSTEYIDPESVNGLNRYVYCGNNPVTRIDPLGHDWWNPFTWNWDGMFNSIGNAVSTAGQWLNDNVISPVGNFLANNWDIIVGVTATACIAAFSIATFGIGTVALGIAVGAMVGTGFGALNAYMNGDSISYGALSGAIVGALSGIGGPGIKGVLLAGLASALGASTTSLIGDRVNNRPRDFKAAGISALTAGIFSGLGNGFGNFLASAGREFAIQIAANSMGAFYFSSYIFVADMIVKAATRG